MFSCYKTFVLLLFVFPLALVAKKVEIELQSGSSVSGEVLKKTSEYWVLDLGFTVLPTGKRAKIRSRNHQAVEKRSLPFSLSVKKPPFARFGR